MLDKCNYLGYNKSCNCGFSSSGRASPCQGEGSEFESRNPLQTKTLTKIGECFFLADNTHILDNIANLIEPSESRNPLQK